MMSSHERPVESHPGIPLINHLLAVADASRGYMQKLPENKFAIPRHILADVAYICGALHDIGKATRYFQHYLKDPEHKIIGPKSHALISAFLVREVLESYLAIYDLTQETKVLLIQLAFLIVKRHHGHLQNFEKEHDITEEQLIEVRRQILAFVEPDAEQIAQKVLEPLPFKVMWSAWKEKVLTVSVQEIHEAYYILDDDRWFDAATDLFFHDYYLAEYIFSCLLLADKSDVIGTGGVKSEVISYELLERYRVLNGHTRPKGFLNEKRHQAYIQTLIQIEETVSADQPLYSITLPTGMGKTLLSLGAAIKVRDRLLGVAGRLVFGIPFTSIIDQNFNVFSEVLGTTHSTVLLKHHHLATSLYKPDDDDTVLEMNKSRHLIETWQSALVVTTFVQLFESIITNHKGKLLKLPNLANAIIVLDEVQQIHYERWPLVRLVLKAIANHYNCYFIFTSATQPLLFQPGKEIIELVPAYEQYYQLFNRTKLVVRCRNVIQENQFQAEVWEYLSQQPEDDVLIILNTIKAAKECFSALSDKFSDKVRSCLYLSTHITPFERKRIIQIIKQSKTERKPLLIVSTQLVEAGVDISVDAVFRDLAPLDSIIQAAGRANRNNKAQDPAPVFVYQLEEYKKVSSRIYGGDLLAKTIRLFGDKGAIEEKEFLGLIKAYYQQVKLQADGVTDPLIKDILKLNFDKAGEFKLIEETVSEPIYVMLTEEAINLWDQHVSILSEDSLTPWERKERLSEIKSRFYDYVINIRVPFNHKSIRINREPIFGFYLIQNPENDSAYNYHHEDPAICTGFQESASTISF